MFRNSKILHDFCWDVNKYKDNYEPEYWDLCRSFMLAHITKYPEERLVNLTEAFYQMGVYGSSYDPKTTRIVSALAIDVLDDFLDSHPGLLKHPFKKNTRAAIVISDTEDSDADVQDTSQSDYNVNVSVDTSILVTVLVQQQLEELLKGFIIIYDVKTSSKLNDNTVTILEESFKRSGFGPCDWEKEDTHNNLFPIRMSLKWKEIVLAEAVGSEIRALRTRVAQAVLSKIAVFSSGIEAKWNYYRDGRVPDLFNEPDPGKSNIYKIISHSEFKTMDDLTDFIDTFACSDSFAEVIFGLDFSSREKKQMTDFVNKHWDTTLTYRTISKMGAKSKIDTHLCLYHIKTGEELRQWLTEFGGENERYRLVHPGRHKRTAACDSNIRELLTTDSGVNKNSTSLTEKFLETDNEKENGQENDLTQIKEDEEENDDDLSKLLEGFVLFYDAKKNSVIDKDDWYSVLCNSFRLSKFKPLEDINEVITPFRSICTLKWDDRILASEEGLTETQAKTAAALGVISKLEPFTYIIQAKEEYFYNGKVPPFVENPDLSKSNICRVFQKEDLPSLDNIFQVLDEFSKKPCHGEIVFGNDFPWSMKNEIIETLNAKGLDYRFFTQDSNEETPTHMAVYHKIKPEKLKDYLIKIGGENAKYKLIPPPSAGPLSPKTSVREANKGEVALSMVEKGKGTMSENEHLEDDAYCKELKEFKDLIAYPDDSGGDFPGLILWVGTKKNSTLQKNLYSVLFESFKLSKFAELSVLENEEMFWGVAEPVKKCFIIHDKKVLAIGLGTSKTEAKHNAALQVLQQLRKCYYTIQAKESYFKEGKSLPLDFSSDQLNGSDCRDRLMSNKKQTSDPLELSNVTFTVRRYFKSKGKGLRQRCLPFRIARRDRFKYTTAIFDFISKYCKESVDQEVIFGEDFSRDELKAIIEHCQKANITYRLIKCKSIENKKFTHVAIYQQKPLPELKDALMKRGGENDKYRLIPPGGKIICPTSQRVYESTESLKEELLKRGGENNQYLLIPPGDIDEERLYTCSEECHPEEDLINDEKNRTIREGEESTTSFSPIPFEPCNSKTTFKRKRRSNRFRLMKRFRYDDFSKILKAEGDLAPNEVPTETTTLLTPKNWFIF